MPLPLFWLLQGVESLAEQASLVVVLVLPWLFPLLPLVVVVVAHRCCYWQVLTPLVQLVLPHCQKTAINFSSCTD